MRAERRCPAKSKPQDARSSAIQFAAADAKIAADANEFGRRDPAAHAFGSTWSAGGHLMSQMPNDDRFARSKSRSTDELQEMRHLIFGPQEAGHVGTALIERAELRRPNMIRKTPGDGQFIGSLNG